MEEARNSSGSSSLPHYSACICAWAGCRTLGGPATVCLPKDKVSRESWCRKLGATGDVHAEGRVSVAHFPPESLEVNGIDSWDAARFRVGPRPGAEPQSNADMERVSAAAVQRANRAEALVNAILCAHSPERCPPIEAGACSRRLESVLEAPGKDVSEDQGGNVFVDEGRVGVKLFGLPSHDALYARENTARKQQQADMIAAVKAAFHDNLAPQIARVVIPQLQQALRNELKNLVREVAGEDDREAKRLKTTVAGAETIRPPEERTMSVGGRTGLSVGDINTAHAALGQGEGEPPRWQAGASASRCPPQPLHSQQSGNGLGAQSNGSVLNGPGVSDRSVPQNIIHAAAGRNSDHTISQMNASNAVTHNHTHGVMEQGSGYPVAMQRNMGGTVQQNIYNPAPQQSAGSGLMLNAVGHNVAHNYTGNANAQSYAAGVSAHQSASGMTLQYDPGTQTARCNGNVPVQHNAGHTSVQPNAGNVLGQQGAANAAEHGYPGGVFHQQPAGNMYPTQPGQMLVQQNMGNAVPVQNANGAPAQQGTSNVHTQQVTGQIQGQHRGAPGVYFPGAY